MEMEITPVSWERLEHRLTLDERERGVGIPRSRPLTWWKYAAAAVVVIAVGVGVARFAFDGLGEVTDIAELKEAVHRPAVTYEDLAAGESPSAARSGETALSTLFRSARSVSVVAAGENAIVSPGGIDITIPDIVAFAGSGVNNGTDQTDDNWASGARNRNYNSAYYSNRLSDYYDDRPYGTSSGRNRSPWGASIYSGTLSQANGGTNLTAMSLSRLSSYEATIVEASYRNNTVALNGQKLKHSLPVNVGFSVRKELTDRVSLQTGISYSYLHATAELDASFRWKYDQKLHYLGIPLSVNYSVLERNGFDLYLTGGVMMEKAIFSKFTTSVFSGNTLNSVNSDKLNTKGLLWSANAGVGAGYYFLDNVGIYFEVGGNYYLPNHNHPESYKTVNPWSANMKAGLSFRF